MKKPKRVKFKLMMVLLILFSILAGTNTVWAQQNKIPRMVLISRVDFVPEILEMIRKNFMRKNSRNVSLVFQPLEKNFQFNVDAKSSYILLEDGMPTENLIGDFERTACGLSLVWVLVARKDFFSQLPSANPTLEDFGKALLQRKKTAPYVYPWFESLYSKNSLLNLSLALGQHTQKGAISKKPFWNQKGVIRILYRAMEQGLLNPLSVEADQLLATNVFLAGDSICFTLWVPMEYLFEPALATENLGDVVLLPFPGTKETAGIPKISFHLWKRKPAENIECSENQMGEPEGYSFSAREFAKDSTWMEEKFSEAYDMLIMGDF